MLQLNRIYTPEELRALARRPPAESRRAAGFKPDAGRSNGHKGRKTVIAVLARLARRSGARRPAPGTT